MTTSPLSRRDRDRFAALDASRAEHTARLHAAFYEALADAVVPDPDLGCFADEAATVLRRAYNTACLGLLDIAVKAEAQAAEYREALEEGRA